MTTFLHRSRTRLAHILAGGLAAVLAAACGLAERPVSGREPVAVDHHLHVHAPEVIAFLQRRFCNSPQLPEGCDPAFANSYTIADLLAAMDAAGVRSGALLSSAYLAESAFVDPADPAHADILHDGNAFTEAAARAHPDRLMAFISLNPLTPTALPELGRWKGDPFVTGIKLHLTNSGVDLRNPDHVLKLAGVFRAAAAARFAIVIHMRSEREDYGAEDVRIFLRDVLPAAGGSTVQVAHAGGWGGLDTNTLNALEAFANAIDADPSLRRRLYFDLAGVWDDDSSEDDMARLVELIRRIGLRQFLPASDWPFAFDLKGYYDKDYPRLPLSEAEWSTLRGNSAPYVPDRLKQ